MNIGVIGFGLRSEFVLKNFNDFGMDVQLKSVCDLDVESAKVRIKRIGYNPEDVRFYDDVDEMMQKENLDGVVIGTNCGTHTDFAIQVMKYNKPIFLEKPVSITMDQVKKLHEANKYYQSEAVISFPLRMTPICKLAKEIIQSNRLGEITHIQAVNNVPYGRVYYRDWYRDESATGGLFLQKSTHDIDYLNYLVAQQATSIVAMESKQIFKGNKEEGTTCKSCDEYKTCPESSYTIKYEYRDSPAGENCSFGVDTGNHDSASMIIRYESGLHAVYSQNFVVRHKAGKRGVRVIGYKGTLEFDFYTNELKVYSHTLGTVETHQIDVKGLNHFGGDKALCENFVEVMSGKGKSKANLQDGINSAYMCLSAKESAQNNTFCELML